MFSLLNDLRLAPAPPALANKTSLVHVIKEAHTALIRAALRSTDPDSNIEDDIRDVRRYAIWLESTALKSVPVDTGSAALAASLYEFAATLQPESAGKSLFTPPLNDLLRSAVISSLTSYQAHAGSVGRRVLELLKSQDTSTATERCHVLSAQCISALLARDFQFAFLLHFELIDDLEEATVELERNEAVEHEFMQLDIGVALGLAMGRIGIGMMVGDAATVQRSIARLREIRDTAMERADAQFYWLSDRLLTVTEHMYQHSMHRILSDAGVPTAYRRALANDGIYELWAPQREAIRQGLLSDEVKHHFIVSIPTGSGKTLLAELAILSALAEANSSWAVYVTPSRALVNQVSGDLRRRLQGCGITVQTVLAGAEQSLSLDDELDLLTSKRTVTVTTPEKMDMYYRVAHELFNQCSLMIIDEAHKIGDGDRGAALESLISRVLVNHVNIQLIMMSGVLSNARELVEWIGSERCVSVIQRSRPVRQVHGIAVRQDSPTSIDEPMKKNKVSRRVQFKGGVVLALDEDDLVGEVAVDLIDLFEGYYTESLRNGQWAEDRDEAKSANTTHAVELAQAMARARGTILVFMQDTRWVQSSALRFQWEDDLYSDAREDLAELIASELGNAHPLVALCRRGVAFHHARLPSSVQRAIEYALERGWLKAVFATATLREGINSTATTVIVAGDQFWDPSVERPKSMSEADYANLAGRAGRPGIDTEGRIILVPHTLAQARAIETGKRYILAGEAALRVRSQFQTLASALERSRRMLDLPAQHQRILLGLRAADLSDEDGVELFFLRSLWSFQEEDDLRVRRVMRGAVRALADALDEVGEQRLNVAAKTGLSLRSAEFLRETLLDYQDLFEAQESQHQLIEDRVSVLLRASIQLPEIRQGELRKIRRIDDHLPVVMEWLSASDYTDILEIGKEAGVFGKGANVSHAVRYCSDVSMWLSWSFGAAVVILASLTDELDPEVGDLPLLIRYGVPTAAGAYSALLGIHDRKIASRLGHAYLKQGTSVTLQHVRTWLEDIDFDLVLRDERSQLRRQLLPSFATSGTGRLGNAEVASCIAMRELTADTVVSLSIEGENIEVRDGTHLVGVIIGGNATSIRHLARSSRNPLTGIVAASIQVGQRGRIIAMVTDR